MRDVLVPNSDVSTMCRKFTLDPRLKGRSLVSFRAFIENNPGLTVSKLKLYLCDGDPQEGKYGWDCGHNLPRHCKELVWTWSNQKTLVQNVPYEYGFHVDPEYSYAMLETVFERNSTANFDDSSGVFVKATTNKKLRSSLLMTGVRETDIKLKDEAHFTGECSPFCTDQIVPEEGYKLYGFQANMRYHLNGSMKSHLIRKDGKEEVLFRIDEFTQQSQSWTSISPVILKKGDSIKTACHYFEGEDSHSSKILNETCVVFFSYHYPTREGFGRCLNYTDERVEMEMCGRKEYINEKEASPCDIDLFDSQMLLLTRTLMNNCTKGECDGPCLRSMIDWTSQSCVERFGLKRLLYLCDEQNKYTCEAFTKLFESCTDTCYSNDDCPVGYPCTSYQCKRLKNGLMIFLMVLILVVLVGSMLVLFFSIRRMVRRSKAMVYMEVGSED